MRRLEPRATLIGRWVGRIVLAALVAAFGIPMVRFVMRQSEVLTDLQPDTPERYAETQRRAEALIAALRAYQARNGRFPDRLADLVPSELSETEAPLVGDGNWEYRRPSPDRFVLKFFMGPIYEFDRYDSASGWYADH